MKSEYRALLVIGKVISDGLGHRPICWFRAQELTQAKIMGRIRCALIKAENLDAGQDSGEFEGVEQFREIPHGLWTVENDCVDPASGDKRSQLRQHCPVRDAAIGDDHIDARPGFFQQVGQFITCLGRARNQKVEPAQCLPGLLAANIISDSVNDRIKVRRAGNHVDMHLGRFKFVDRRAADGANPQRIKLADFMAKLLKTSQEELSRVPGVKEQPIIAEQVFDGFIQSSEAFRCIDLNSGPGNDASAVTRQFGCKFWQDIRRD